MKWPICAAKKTSVTMTTAPVPAQEQIYPQRNQPQPRFSCLTMATASRPKVTLLRARPYGSSMSKRRINTRLPTLTRQQQSRPMPPMALNFTFLPQDIRSGCISSRPLIGFGPPGKVSFEDTRASCILSSRAQAR